MRERIPAGQPEMMRKVREKSRPKQKKWRGGIQPECIDSTAKNRRGPEHTPKFTAIKSSHLQPPEQKRTKKREKCQHHESSTERRKEKTLHRFSYILHLL